MGELLRRFWMPALLSRGAAERDGPPKKIKILGEDLLAFRATDGQVGIVEPHCPHRGANLYYGRNEECGLRCAFHGWKFDVDGNCVDLPTSPPESSYKDTIKLLAYPTREWGDMIWVYMGPREQHARAAAARDGAGARGEPLRHQEVAGLQLGAERRGRARHLALLLPARRAGQGRRHGPRRPGQGRDRRPVHSPTIASAGYTTIRGRSSPCIGHDAGLLIGAARKTDAADLYWRISQFLMPNHAYTPTAFPGEIYYGQCWVPVDDVTCWIYTYCWQPDRPFSNAERTKFDGGFNVHAEVDDDYLPLRNLRNDYLIDRKVQKHDTFTGIEGVSEQDAAIQDSMGPIQDRTREHLGPTDIGVVEFRKLLMGAARALGNGEEPKAAQAPRPLRRARRRLRSPRRTRISPQVMTERFGHRHGYVGNQYGLGD